jgi:hypothetical protein
MLLGSSAGLLSALGSAETSGTLAETNGDCARAMALVMMSRGRAIRLFIGSELLFHCRWFSPPEKNKELLCFQ